MHADRQEGEVGVQRQGVPVVQPVANASLADTLEVPSEQQQQQPVHGDHLIAVLRLQERDPEEEKVVMVAEQMELLPMMNGWWLGIRGMKAGWANCRGMTTSWG